MMKLFKEKCYSVPKVKLKEEWGKKKSLTSVHTRIIHFSHSRSSVIFKLTTSLEMVPIFVYFEQK